MAEKKIFLSAHNKIVGVRESLIATGNNNPEEIFKLLEKTYATPVITLPETILAEFKDAKKFTPGNVRLVLKVRKELTVDENKMLLDYVLSDSSSNLVE
jgi:hypothetical protein